MKRMELCVHTAASLTIVPGSVMDFARDSFMMNVRSSTLMRTKMILRKMKMKVKINLTGCVRTAKRTRQSAFAVKRKVSYRSFQRKESL